MTTITENKYAISPLNYVGGKGRLLPQILPLFPSEINTFVDLFAGGCNVGVNVQAKQIVCNDIQIELIEIYNEFNTRCIEDILTEIKSIIEKYELSKLSKDEYYTARKEYNESDRRPLFLYTLIAHAMNYQVRFNSKGEYNMSSGYNRSYFSQSLEKKLVSFVNRLKEIDVKFTSVDFLYYNYSKLTSDDFVYCDPPYLITNANYNKIWNEERERQLLTKLDELNDKGVKFALSNALQVDGKVNEILTEWARKYNVHHLNYSYNNSNYAKKNKDGETVEVLITNYKAVTAIE